MNKSIQSLLIGALVCCGINVSSAASYPTPPAKSAYMTNQQTSYAKDPTSGTFSGAGDISCMINLMSPEQHVNAGQYVALIDQNLCNDTSTSTTSGSSVGSDPSWVNAVLNVTQNTDSSIDVIGSLFVQKDGDGRKKIIQIHGTVWGGAAVYAPYGKWTMKYCSTLASSAVGSCDDGSGYVAVDTTGITTYQVNASNHQAGTVVYTSPTTGYGIIDDTSNSPKVSGRFRFGNGIYLWNDAQSGAQSCYDPSLSNPNVQYSTWQNYLYDQNTGAKLAYTNPGFFISEHGSTNQIGEANYDGLNFWSQDTPAQVNATTVDGPDGTAYTVHKMPGTLRKVTTNVGNFDQLDGLGINFGFWGDQVNGVSGNIAIVKQICNLSACQSLSSSNNIGLIGTWSKSTSKFTFTGFADWNNNGSITNFPATAVSYSDLTGNTYKIRGGGGWINGANTNYNFQMSQWNCSGGSCGYSTYTPATAPVTKQSQLNIKPSELSAQTLYCVGGNCPAWTTTLTDVSTFSGSPSTSKQDIGWDPSTGTPTISGHAIDWSSSTLNPNQQSHYYNLYTADNLSAMACTANGGSAGAAYCSNLITSPASGSTTYYTWQSGGQWDSYAYLTGPSGNSPTFDPPINLSYTVPALPGNTASYVGSTISFQSPQPGNLWVPGHCIDSSGAQAACNSSNQWVSDVNIPFAQDATGTVNKTNSDGSATSTSYYVKWLQRGVYFTTLPIAQCSGLDLSAASGLTLPGTSLIDPAVAQQPVPSQSVFQSKPSVVNGAAQ